MRNMFNGLGALTLAAAIAVTASAQPMPQTTKETIRGQATAATEVLRGTVEYVEGNQLVVRMSDGDIRHFTPPPSRRFIIDAKELTVRDLKPGTKLTATVTTTTTPVTERTKTIGTATVWWVSGNTVILTLPNGENKTYQVKDDYKFNIGGQKASVSELRKGMRISAEKIVEAPITEITSDTVVTGQAPPPPAPKQVAAQAPPAPREVATRPSPAPAPAQAPAAAPPPAPAPAPSPVAKAGPEPQLPATGTNAPLAGVLGLLLTSAGLGLRMLSRRRAG